ncbi:MAG: LysR family transcriptional regulator [Acidobacteria bacterium]|nr:LysR family transcriptional regulator [Acidobacteriota bacterium]
MDLHQLRYFLTVARTGSFVRAAEEENVAQPSLSQQIKKLEAALGVPLFDRLGRGVRLTRYGQALAVRAQEILRSVGDAEKELSNLRHPDCGRLTLGIIPTVLPYAMAKPMAAFRDAAPHVELDIREATTEKLLEGLRNGEIDLAILALPVRQPEIVCAELFREPLLVAVPGSHPLAERPKLAVPQLLSERMLLLREGHCLRDDVLTVCSRAHVQFQQVFESDHLASIFSLVANGFGISIVPALAAAEARGCKLVPLEPRGVRKIGYAQVRGHHALPVQKRFISFLRAYEWMG